MSVKNGEESVKFPIFSLLIREFDAESSSHQTASSATQSEISAFSKGNCRGKLALFPDLRAPEKLRFGRHQPILALFSLSQTEPVPHSILLQIYPGQSLLHALRSLRIGKNRGQGTNKVKTRWTAHPESNVQCAWSCFKPQFQ